MERRQSNDCLMSAERRYPCQGRMAQSNPTSFPMAVDLCIGQAI
jgi:hypothetical protein